MLFRDKNIDITEKLGFGMIFALIGGFMDVYSYTAHGKVFATGQTGNLVLMGVHMVQGDYHEMLHAMVPIVSFWIGVFISMHLSYSFGDDQLKWKRRIIISEIIIFFIVGFIPKAYPDIIANAMVSFAASLQYCSFRKFGSGEGYANIFCTGNMRSCAENYYRGIVRGDRQSLKRAVGYSGIVMAFVFGVVSGSMASSIFGGRAIWCADIIMLIVVAVSFAPDEKKIFAQNSAEM